MSFYCVVLASLVLFQTCLTINGLVEHNGNCSKIPKIPSVNNFNITKFMGNWWQVANYERVFGNCARSHFVQRNPPYFQEIMDHMFPNGTHFQNIGQGGPSSDPTAVYDITAQWADGTNRPVPHWILGVDYNHWCILWLCVGNKGGVVILSRTPKLPQQYQERVNMVFERAGFNRNLLHNVTNSHCPDYD